MDKDYTKEIRKIVISLYERLLSRYRGNFSNIDMDTLYSSVLESLNVSEKPSWIHGYFNPFFSDKSFALVLGTISLVRNQMYIDYYKKLNLKSKLGTINSKEEEYFNVLKNNSESSLRNNLSKDIYSDLSKEMLKAIIEYKNLSVFEKILEIKALSVDDINLLNDNILFFEEDIERYNIDITLEFIKDRINKLNNGSFKDNNERTYNEVVDFIFNLYKIHNNDEFEKNFIEDLVIECEEEDIFKDSDDDFINTTFGKVYKNNLKNMLKSITKNDTNKVKQKNTDER